MSRPVKRNDQEWYDYSNVKSPYYMQIQRQRLGKAFVQNRVFTRKLICGLSFLLLNVTLNQGSGLTE